MESYWGSISCSATRISRISRTPKFHSVVTTTRHQTVTWTRYSQFSSSHCVSLSSILILYCYLHLGLASGVFTWGAPTKTLCSSWRKAVVHFIAALCKLQLTSVQQLLGVLCDAKRMSCVQPACAHPSVSDQASASKHMVWFSWFSIQKFFTKFCHVNVSMWRCFERQWRSTGRRTWIAVCTLHSHCPVLVQFGTKALHIMLLNICEYHENCSREDHLFFLWMSVKLPVGLY